jgi:GSH-dependent disulfide-bond oxidoreductase
MVKKSEALVLYGVGSPNVSKVTIMLEELGLSYELRPIAVFSGEQFTPGFLAMNPFGKVPVLIDPLLGRPLYESGAILFYLAERYGEFLPAETADRYEVMQWLTAQMANIGPMFGQLNHFRRALRSGTEPYAEARFAELSRRLYRCLDDRLRGHSWIAGGAYSIADMAIYPWSLYLERHGFATNDYPALIRWRERMSARPAIARSNARFDEAFAETSIRDRKSATDADLDRFFGHTESAPPADFSAIKG